MSTSMYRFWLLVVDDRDLKILVEESLTNRIVAKVISKIIRRSSHYCVLLGRFKNGSCM